MTPAITAGATVTTMSSVVSALMVATAVASIHT
jgi:hypothetical protein